MTIVTIEGKFNTSMGIILKVKNDRVFNVGDVINTNDGKYIIDKIAHTINPDRDEYMGLIVSKLDK